MDGRELLVGEDLQALTGTLQALGQIFLGLALAVGQQFDGVIALFALGDVFQAHHHFRFAEQEDVQALLFAATGQFQQGFQRGGGQRLGVIHQDVDLLPRQAHFRRLRENGRRRLAVGAHALGDLGQHGTGVAAVLRGNHHAVHGLLLGTGRQRLAQQRLATALGAADYQQQLAVAAR